MRAHPTLPRGQAHSRARARNTAGRLNIFTSLHVHGDQVPAFPSSMSWLLHPSWWLLVQSAVALWMCMYYNYGHLVRIKEAQCYRTNVDHHSWKPLFWM